MENNHLEQKMLKPFDDMLRCRICSGFFNYCVITACSHNFCSACLKKQMETESDCCICYEEIQESELRSNRSMDKIVRIYKKLMKTNATDSSDPQYQLPNNSQRNSQIFSSTIIQTVSQTQNCLPVQISSTRSISRQSASPIHNQSQSPTSFTIPSTGSVPVQTTSPIHNVQPQSQSSTSFTTSSTGTAPVQSNPSIQNLQPETTFPVKQEVIECDDNEMQDIGLVSTSEATNDSEDFHTKVLRPLEENRKDLENIKLIGTADLPCKSCQELTLFNTALRDERYFIRVYKSLRTNGGLREKDVVRRCLCRIMKNSVALQYSWRGMRGEKAPFVKLENIIALIFKITSYHYKTITQQTVNQGIKEWLMRAGDRDGGKRRI